MANSGADANATAPLHRYFTEGDIELVPADRSCCFRMRSSTLRRTSQFFADMFASAQPDGAQISLSEDRETVETLLAIVSGLSLPVDKLGDLDRLERLAYAAEKYEMRIALDLVRLMLQTTHMQRPEFALRRHVLVEHFSWDDLADEALLAALDVDLESAPLPPTLGVRDVARLVSLRERRVKAFVEGVDGTLRRACTCPLSVCSDPTGSRWAAFKQSMVLAILTKPSGASVLSADNGPVVVGFLGVTCSSRHTGRRYLWEEMELEIRALIARLPSTL
ncbi:hypothetical protein AURDEDRAFT_154270 [Auricularia subglabra TFB-10046 SS5]|uniref:BTB domain-containing protein n=1 Tax=Auricularia subglabra (strain TFB-10046 / SS5) TaxID=717982 RepID=J0DB25_AURST|nr:hypothetical protein AURDEDRAFT_154270 [Auricularia subglabra TFB-10046 SS5]